MKDAVSHAMVIIRTETAQFKNHKDRKHVSDIITLLKNGMIASSLYTFKWFTVIFGTQVNID